MSKFNSLLMGRFRSDPKKEKMSELAARSAEGTMTPFEGVFQVAPISEEEKGSLQSLLEKYQTDETSLAEDLKSLSTLTSEVKAISNQAVICMENGLKKLKTFFENTEMERLAIGS